MSSNNYARNLRISETPKAIRSNQFNKFTGQFSPKPQVVNTILNEQNLCVTFKVGQKLFRLCDDSVDQPQPETIILYFNGAVNTGWTTLGNWWFDAAHTVAATSLPTPVDSVVATATIAGSGQTVANFTLIGNQFVGLISSLTVTGTATFNGGSGSAATVNGNATFNGSSFNIGTVNGNATFNGSSFNIGTVNGNATFNDNSSNTGTVTGAVTCNTTGTCTPQ
jgi:hypothetical protein